MLQASPRLCLVSLSTVPFIAVGAMTLSRYSKKLSSAARLLEAEATNYVIERFNNITTVKLNGKVDDEKVTYATYSDDSSKLCRSSYWAQGGDYDY